MLKVFKNIDQYDPNKGLFFNWMYTTVRNSALTLLRDQKTRNFYFVGMNENQDFIAYENPFDQLAGGDIHVYLLKLPLATRRICSLYYLEDFSIKEISKELEISEGTVKWHLSESRARLKSIFQKSL